MIVEKQICNHMIACPACNETGEKMLQEIKWLRKMAAGALAFLIRDSWQNGPTENEIQDDLWAYFDNADDDFPLSKDGTSTPKALKYLIKIYEGKSK